MTVRSLLCVAFVVVLAGCAGQPSVYYTLTPSVVQQAQPMAVGEAVGLYTVGSVSVPPSVDDVLIVVRRSNDQLMKLAHDRWTGPLNKQFTNALAVALTGEIGMPPLSRLQAAGDNRVISISVDVQRFDLVPGRYAELAAVWQVVPPNSVGKLTKLVCYSELRESVEPGVAPLVNAQQANIQKLAVAISAGLRGRQPVPGTHCR